MHTFWEASLTRRVIVTLACAMSAFWLLSETISFYYRYTKAETEIRVDLARELAMVSAEESRRYEFAQIRVNTLSRLWGELCTRTYMPSDNTARLKHTVFVPFEGVTVDMASIAAAGQTIEIFGDSDPVKRIDTFLLLPGKGVFFYKPDISSAADMNIRMRALSSQQYTSAISGNHWGTAFKDASGALRTAVIAGNAYSTVKAGQLLRVDDLNLRKYEFLYILRDSSGSLLWSSFSKPPALLALKGRLPDCHQSLSTRVEDFFVECTPLKGPEWQLTAVAPSDVVMSRVLSLLSSTVPWTLLAQVLLLILIAFVLQRRLGRPLSHIVEIINRQKKVTDLSDRLPEGRKDELGRIASAYNTLLKTLNAYHQTLEDKVSERTRELDVAKRIAERANHRKSEHLTSISHEIRTPLNGIIGALSLLERSSLSVQQQELVGTARQSSGFLLSIVNNLLDFSRIEAGQLELSYEQTAILPMLDQVLLTINLRAQEKRLALQTLVAAEVPQSALLDSVRVQQILINLLGNAVKFTSSGGVYVRVERRADMLVITVRDTGKGIPEENQLDIFMPFIQVRAHDNGSGLGLAIASRLANLMGGEILLDSQVGVGSRFMLLLPLHEPTLPLLAFSASLVAPPALHQQLRSWGIQAATGDSPLLDMPELVYLPGRLWQKVSAIVFEEKIPGEEVASIAPCPWALKVLIVDDILINRDIVGKMLRELGHQTQTAATGEEALQLGREQVFDLVLMDIRMPEMDGLQVTRYWRDMASGMLDQDVPIMALTANALPAERDRARAAGMNGYLAKPVSLEQLAVGVGQAVSLQLARGIDLAPNQGLQQPLLNLADAALRNKLYETLETLHKDIAAARQANERVQLLDLLHSLKGCAGQGGLGLVCELVEQQELHIHQGNWPSAKDVSDLGWLIQQTK
nr:two component system sensor kinase [Pseudomonas farris]